MQDAEGKILYVGKARNLKKRVSSYFHKKLSSSRLVSLIKQVKSIDIIVTHNETEALLLENQLIKKFYPRYNILLRDDKSFPFIVLTEHKFPRLFSQRGEKQGKGQYFGPYPSTQAVREAVDLIQKTFRLRTCRDTFFRHRTRPCLLHQIHRCTAPCVKYISEEDYGQDIRNAKLLLSGKNQQVIDELIRRMEHAATTQQYERAAMLRDQIASLRHVQTQQVVTTAKGDIDIFTVITQKGVTAVEALYIRHGNLSGSHTFYPQLPENYDDQRILASFIPQYYLSRPLPGQIVIKQKIPQQQLLVDALNQLHNQRSKIVVATRGESIQWLKMAEHTAIQAITSKLAATDHYQARLAALQQLLQLTNLPTRMECFDISHSAGEATVASCVVFNHQGPQKNAYRRFNIEGIAANDDYAAIRQAVMRRYQRIKKNEEILPDTLFIDGGKGQLKQAEEVLKTLGITQLTVVAVAKGITRKPGMEQLFIPGRKQPLVINPDSPALHLIQQIRDEAHRFALTGHRLKRAKNRRTSPLENIPGIGPQKRRELLRQLGGLQEVKKASIADLQKVPGISPQLAERIYQALHG